MKKIIFFILIGIFFASCEKFLDVNTSQDTPEVTSPNYMLPAVLGNMAYTHFEQGDMTAYFTQQVTTQYGTSSYKDRWDFRNPYRMGLWRKNYFDVAGNAEKMILFAEDEGSQNYLGVGKVMKAFSFLTATDFFGDMPVLQAFSGIYNPTYDAQEVVYNEVKRWLDEGIAHLEASTSSDRKMDAAADRIYNGNTQNWIAFAHAVKARYYLHLNDFANVLSEIDKAKTNWKEPVFTFFAGSDVTSWQKNPWGQSKARPQWDMVENTLDASVTTEFFMQAITLADDSSRLYALTSPGKNNKYAAAPASEGIGATSIDDFAKLTRGYWTKDESPIIYITTEEIYFMEAEAAFHTGDQTRAYTAYINGIKANFTKLSISDKTNDYLTSAAVKQSSGSLTISDVMMQKYIALYLQPETWSDMRRYNYSSAVYTGLAYPANVLLHLSGQWIQRLPYDPQTEYIYNPKEIERLGATVDDWVAKKIWWVERSTLGK